jgi:hypothetical protein
MKFNARLSITSLTVTQPTCALPTGTIVVKATGNNTLEYSVDDGATWQPGAHVWCCLVPGSYNIKVRLVASPACIDSYSGNR